MTQEGNAKDDVKIPESDLGKEIQAGFDDGKDLLVTIISAMGEEQVSMRRICLIFHVLSSCDRLSPTRRHPSRAKCSNGMSIH